MTETAPTPALTRFLTGEVAKKAKKPAAKPGIPTRADTVGDHYSVLTGMLMGELNRAPQKNMRALSLLFQMTETYRELMSLLAK